MSITKGGTYSFWMELSLLWFIYLISINLINLPRFNIRFTCKEAFPPPYPYPYKCRFYNPPLEQGGMCSTFPRFCFIELTIKCHKCCKYNNISVICFTSSEFTVWMTFKVYSDDIQGNNSTRSEEQPQQKLTGGSGYHVPRTNKPAVFRLLEEPQTSYYTRLLNGWMDGQSYLQEQRGLWASCIVLYLREPHNSDWHI